MFTDVISTSVNSQFEVGVETVPVPVGLNPPVTNVALETTGGFVDSTEDVIEQLPQIKCTSLNVEGPVERRLKAGVYTLDCSLRNPEKFLCPESDREMLFIPEEVQKKSVGNLVRRKLSSLINQANSLKGSEYLDSKRRRVLELSVAIPAAIVATPMILLLAGIQKLANIHDKGFSAFFLQERMAADGTVFKVWKIRTMRIGSDLSRDNIDLLAETNPEDDPRVTGIGKFLRKFELDELPQILQVVQGNLSLIGSRATPLIIMEFLEGVWETNRYKQWRDGYRSSLTGLNQTLNLSPKDDRSRDKLDNFYAQNACLGLDIYILWRTLLRIPRIRPRGSWRKR